MTRKRSPAPEAPAPKAPVTEPGYRVRLSVFKVKGAAVFYPSGSDPGCKRRGYPTKPLPAYRPPVEEVRTTSTFEQARGLVRELRLEHGEDVVIHVERIETALPAPRPKQLSLADLADDRPRGWPQQRWTQ